MNHLRLIIAIVFLATSIQANDFSNKGAQPVLPPVKNNKIAKLQAGQQYSAGTRVDAAENGVSFVLPAEWLGSMDANRPVFLMGSHTRPGLGLAIIRSNMTPSEVLALLSGPQDFGSGLILYPNSNLQRDGDKLKMSYSGGEYIGEALAISGSDNNGVVFFFAGPQSEKAYYQSLLQELAAGTRFENPQTDPAVLEWQQLLSGMMLKKMSSYSSSGYDGSYVGSSSTETLNLCSDGSYQFYSSSSFSVDAGASAYSGDRSQDGGSWMIDVSGGHALLVLQSSTGTQSQFTLQMVNGKTLLDGQRVFRVRSDSCR